MPFRHRSLLAWLLLQPWLAATAWCVASLADGYVIRVWQTEDGLPQNMVTSAVQTRDGYLWFGTYSGLARFDGERFEVFDSTSTPELPERRIARLYEDEAGTVWVGHEGGGITRYRDGRFELHTPPSGTVGEKVIGLGGDEQGRLWAMRENGAVDLLDTGTRLPSLIAAELPGVMGWSRHERGHVWLVENGRAARLENGAFVPVSLGSPGDDAYVLGVAAAADGGAWLFCQKRVRKWREGGWVEDRGECPWAENPVPCALELRDGTLAVGTIDAGLYLFFPDGRPSVHLDRTDGLPQNWIRFLYEDREGSLWVGAGSAGLVSIHASAFSVLNAPDQWKGCTVLSVAPSRANGLWVGTDGAALYHHADGRWTRYTHTEGLTNSSVPAVAESPSGEVWAGNYWWGGPYRLENGRFVRPAGIDERSSPVFALAATEAPGELLVGNRDGLLQLQETGLRWLLRTGDAAAGVCAIARDRSGGIWCGLVQGGLVHLDGERRVQYRRADGLASDAVQCLHADERGMLWIGTADRGLSRFKDGRFVTLGKEQGLVDNVVCAILDDGLGYLWLSTHRGLQRIAKDELDRCADGRIAKFASHVYDRHDGLPTSEFTGGLQAAGCRTPDGRLWFASSKGVVSVDPTRIESNRSAPPVVIESLLVDGQNVTTGRRGWGQRLPPDHQRLEFRYGGLSYVAPNKVLFKYRLDGIDQTWSEAGARRAAFYSRLPAGDYRFRVIACNNDGVWNTAGATVAFTVAPFFWQTWWFLGSGALLAAAAVAMGARHFTRRRMQRRLEQLERQHAIERERTRIAQDIHDDVGSSLVQIAMLSQPVREDLKEPARAALLLSRIYTTARAVTRALDEIVWAVDPSHDTLDSLADYMGRFAQSALAVTNLRCRLDLPAAVPSWPLSAETRHNLFLAYKEALNNAIKHADASEVRIVLVLDAASFTLAVKDNGRGFVRAQGAQARTERVLPGHGLANMSKRLAHVGGRCEITSVAGEGTTVSFFVPQSKPHPASAEPSVHADSPPAAS